MKNETTTLTSSGIFDGVTSTFRLSELKPALLPRLASDMGLNSQTLLVCDFHVILSDLFHKNAQNPVLDSYIVKKYYEIRDNY